MAIYLNDLLNDSLTRWMAFIDVDEFIDPAPGTPIHAAGTPNMRFGGADGFFTELDTTAMAARRR